jgi:transcriptional regulator with XRE-family HTH domain
MQVDEFVTALVQHGGLSTLATATRIRNARFQGTLHKLMNGGVRQPTRDTAKSIADYFHVDIDAFYDPRTADREANRLGLKRQSPGFANIPQLPSYVAREDNGPGFARSLFDKETDQRLRRLTPSQLGGVQAVVIAHLDAIEAQGPTAKTARS